MTSPETPGEFISDEAVYQFAQTQLDNWEFTDHPGEINNYFAFHLAAWAIDTYESREGSMKYLVDDVPGDELPSSLRIMVQQNWADGSVHYTDQNRINMLKSPEFTYVSAQIPKWDTVQELPTYDQQLAAIANDPEICSNIVLPSVVAFEQVTIYFAPKFFHGWGLEFRLTPDTTHAAPFGKAGETWPAAEYVATAAAHPRILSETAAALAVLAAKHHERAREPWIPADFLPRFEQRLLGEESLPIDTSSFQVPPSYSIQHMLVQELVKLGKVPSAPEPKASD